ncbi:NCA2-domain-containing protein [Moesziomyces antarcticus]|uniref:Related to NCA2 - control of mitochondrial synthesis of Atp6p and Atp8p n=1 Tax=Pseudozyma antarctica TaxID=84753 RepID=A0A5C3FIT9_PSEA2|nr:NCA2-domain-containing protein [Moesziomyces antarcticus]GAK63655.1 NCA2-domain-containing protein [Moesziomyces antarcticus]SPO44248.1 related to NCA2 - control of mitochondrial synthesis of Atp6p and Atp8p [Moesziomyces antarcticus]
MTYSSDVYGRLGTELEIYDSLLSATNTPAEKAEDAGVKVASSDAGSKQASGEDHKKPIQEILSSIRPSDASSTLPSRKTLISLLDKLDSFAEEQGVSGVPHVEELKIAALSRLVVATYAAALDTLLQDASKLEDETWYWTDIEESMRKTVSYLIQTLPVRFFNVTKEVLELAAGTATHTLKSTIDSTSADTRGSDLSHKAKSLDKGTVRAALRSVLDTPNLVTSMLFPYTFRLEKSITLESVREEHESQQRKVATLRTQLSANSATGGQLEAGAEKIKKQRVKALRSTMLTLTPTYLARHEAKCKRRGLVNERNLLAAKLGRLALQHEALADQAQQLNATSSDSAPAEQIVLGHLNAKLKVLVETFSNSEPTGSKDVNIDMDASLTPEATLSTLRLLLKEGFDKQQDRVQMVLSPEVFGQPSALVQRWPKLVLYPVGLVLLARYLSNNWNGIEAKLKETKETVRSFLIGWVWEPCVGLLDTIRHGNEGSVIVSRESLASDLQSLERMVTDFTKDKYGTSGAELQAIASRVREGDLTQVLKVYEAEMKSPVKSMVSGSLIRSLLIQVQKAKVDIEVAMTGIDKLLKSQQLLFGAVGIAPALGILYVGQSYLRNKVFNLSVQRSETSGRGYQMRAWEAMRRVDRLLSSPSRDASGDRRAAGGPLADRKDEGRDDLTQGLLLLDLSTLRSASGPLLMSLSRGKKAAARRLQRQFLQDIRDLESGEHRAVERMWRSWGSSVLRLPTS